MKRIIIEFKDKRVTVLYERDCITFYEFLKIPLDDLFFGLLAYIIDGLNRTKEREDEIANLLKRLCSKN